MELPSLRDDEPQARGAGHGPYCGPLRPLRRDPGDRARCATHCAMGNGKQF